MTALITRFWIPAGARFAKRSGRERAIVLAAAIAAAVVVGDQLLLHPHQAQVSALQMREQTLLAPDPGQAAVERAQQSLAQHRRQVAQDLMRVDAALAELTAQMVPAAEMRHLLDSLIAGLPGLRLVQLRNLAPQPVRPGAAGASEPIDGQVYRHGFELTVEGGYADLLQYLERLESAPQRIYWKRAELDASAYPTERLVVEIYTLSREPAWLVL
jgi:MSHA biogenesis protein MshJ